MSLLLKLKYMAALRDPASTVKIVPETYEQRFEAAKQSYQPVLLALSLKGKGSTNVPKLDHHIIPSFLLHYMHNRSEK